MQGAAAGVRQKGHALGTASPDMGVGMDVSRLGDPVHERWEIAGHDAFPMHAGTIQRQRVLASGLLKAGPEHGFKRPQRIL